VRKRRKARSENSLGKDWKLESS